MPEAKGPQEKSLDMRVADIEDKLAKMNVTEEEMRAYEKVSALLGEQQMGTAPSASGFGGFGGISRSRLVCIHRAIIPRQIVRFCYECTCGPCGPVGGEFSGGGGFGSFGG